VSRKIILSILLALAILINVQSANTNAENIIGRFEYDSIAIQQDTIVKEEEPYLIDASEYVDIEEGKSSHYGAKFHKRRTASGERFDMFGFTSAHKKLPFGTIVKVVDQVTGKTAIVRINDRGPFVKGRIIDLSYRAAKGINALGIRPVTLLYFNNAEVIDDFDSTYCLGYSFSRPLAIVHSSAVDTLFESDDFEAAVNELLSLEKPKDSTKTHTYYLFVDAKKTTKKNDYVVGTID
jgi:rare lipoprotein A